MMFQYIPSTLTGLFDCVVMLRSEFDYNLRTRNVG